MHEQEVNDLRERWPLLGHVLREIAAGRVVGESDGLWETYLVARQRGLVGRDSAGRIGVTERASEYFAVRGKVITW